MYKPIITLLLFFTNVSITFAQQSQSGGDPYVDAYNFVIENQSLDPYLIESKKSALKILGDITNELDIPEYDLIIAKIPPALKGDLGVFYTSACSSVFPQDLKPIILCNEDYLYEVEASVRANEMSSIYNTNPFHNDTAIYDFIRNVTPNPKRTVIEMRNIAVSHSNKEVASNEPHIKEHLVLALLFFTGHELGHIKERHPHASLTTIFPKNNKLQENIEIAVVRMCRHAEEFWNEGNGLGGYEWTKDRSSNIRKVEQRYRELSFRYENADDWYEQEKLADEFSVKILSLYLDREYEKDNYSGNRKQYFLIETLHSLGLYSMYRDLSLLGERICPGPLTHTSQLSLCMAMDRDQYIKASSIFSDVHRPMLLRTKTIMNKLLETREDKSGLPKEDRVAAVTEEEFKELVASGNYKKLDLRMWYSQNWQRALLHDILVDTNVKFTMQACSTGWIKEIDKNRGTPQLFIMTFEGVEDAIARLIRMLQGGTHGKEQE